MNTGPYFHQVTTGNPAINSYYTPDNDPSDLKICTNFSKKQYKAQYLRQIEKARRTDINEHT